MSEEFEVGEEYEAKNYLNSGYNFPKGKYKIKMKSEGFPEDIVSNQKELKHAKEQWMDGFEDDKKIYKEIYEGVWYYLKFPLSDDHFEWIPKEVMEDVFK